MKTNTQKKPLYLTLGIIIISTVIIIISLHSGYTFIITKNKIINDMKQTSKLSIISLEKNVADLITAYAANEYDKLVYTEMKRRDNFAIIIEDYNMGKALGNELYVSGKIRNSDGRIIDYDIKNIEQNEQIKKCYYSDKHDITSLTGKKLGTISIYISDQSMNNELNKIITDTIFNTIAISLLLIVTLFITIRLFVLKPLSDIMSVINNNENGIPLEKIPNHGPKEISALSNTINRMVDTIKASNKTLEEQSDALHYQAHYDGLTGLANRFLFMDRLDHAIEHSKRNRSKLALLFIDLDNFKEINDSLGHYAGDKVLKIVSQRLNDIIRKEDTIARLGGDEFTIMTENLGQGQNASFLAHKIITFFSEPIILENRQLYIGCSIGISLYPDDGNSAPDLLKNADAAMYKAKDEGKNNYQYYNAEMTELAFERIVMETSLRTALDNEEFIIYYQPQIDGKNNRQIGMEALVRWQHPTMGLVSPGKFIPLAESTGIIIELDQFVMKTAMKQLSLWHKQGLNPGRLALNLAIKQLQQPNFIAILNELLKETQCKPQWLELEIAESQIMTNPEEAIKILTTISELGIDLAIDDFGTGYSSLSYLKKLPINKLKIDQSFVRDLPDNEEDAAITQAVIALAKSLKLRIIAEGVETEEQKEFLVQNGCHHIQGYFYSRPIPVHEMEKYLLKKRELKLS